MSAAAQHALPTMIASRLAYKAFSPPSTTPIESVSPMHVIFSHGLLGSHRNFQSILSALSGNSNESTARKYPLYNTAGFDWRNHGESAHLPNLSVDGLAEDLETFVSGYSQLVHSSAARYGQSKQSPVPLVLVGHSMGGMGLMHYLWRFHTRWVLQQRAPSDPLPPNPAFSNENYHIKGVLIVDTTPSSRPESYFGPVRAAVQFLAKLPLENFKSRVECEAWLNKHGPPELFNPKTSWVVRYYLSNIDTSQHPIAWRIGLRNIIEGLDRVAWCHGGCSVPPRGCTIADLDPPLPPDSAPTLVEHSYWKEHGIPQLSEVSMGFVLGGDSPYRTSHSLNAIPRYFSNPQVETIPKAGHYLFMTHRDAFIDVVHRFLDHVENSEPSAS